MICIQKIYGFHGINRQNIEKSWYVTPVTEDGRTESGKPGHPGGQGGPGDQGDPGGPGSPGGPGGQGGQDYQPKWYAFRKYMVFMV